jgi:hypothetical protein
VDSEVIHVNHGESRVYVNRVEIMNFFESRLSKLYSKNDLGLYTFLKKKSIDNNLIHRKNSFLDFSAVDSLVNIKTSFSLKDINFSNPVRLTVGKNKRIELILDGAICRFCETDLMIEIDVGVSNEKNSLELKIDEGYLFMTEGRFIDYEVISGGSHYTLNYEKDWMEVKTVKNLSIKMFTNKRVRREQHLLACIKERELLHSVIKFRDVKENQKIQIIKKGIKISSLVYDWKKTISIKDFKVVEEAIWIPIPDELGIGWWAYDIKFYDDLDFEFQIGVSISGEDSYTCEPRILQSTEPQVKTLLYKSIFSYQLGVIVRSSENLKLIKKLELTLYRQNKI